MKMCIFKLKNGFETETKNKTGPGRIWTCDQGIMSPLLYRWATGPWSFVTFCIIRCSVISCQAFFRKYPWKRCLRASHCCSNGIAPIEIPSNIWCLLFFPAGCGGKHPQADRCQQDRPQPSAQRHRKQWKQYAGRFEHCYGNCQKNAH